MFNQFFIFFTLIGIGYLSRKKNWLDEASIKGVGNLLINVAIPALKESFVVHNVTKEFFIRRNGIILNFSGNPGSVDIVLIGYIF
jgi:predicted permease